MFRLPLLVVSASICFGQAADEKPTPAKRANELIERAVDTVPATQPDTQVAALLHLAEIHPDRKKALDLFDQAFAAASAMPQNFRALDRAQIQAEVVTVAAERDIDRGIALLRQMQTPASTERDSRVDAINRIVAQLCKEKRVDQAVELVTTMGSEGDFPFDAASTIIRSVPEDDPRRMQLFAAASTAYSARPRGPFARFISANWKFAPQQMADIAVSALLRNILEQKEEGYTHQTISSSKGAVSFTSRADSELFQILHVVQQINPKRAQELLETRIGLREAVTKYPNGVDSLKAGPNDGLSTSTSSGGKDSKPDPESLQRMRLESLASSKMQQAMSALPESADKALAIIKEIPVESVQATALGRVARSVAEKDPSTAKAVLTQCTRMLDEQKSNSVEVWLDVAEAAHKIKDDERAKMAFDRAMAGALKAFKEDTDAERPNTALREYWPSTQSFRRIVHRATTLYGIDAEYLLPKITDNDLSVLANIEMARALLKKPNRSNTTSVSRSSRR